MMWVVARLTWRVTKRQDLSCKGSWGAMVPHRGVKSMVNPPDSQKCYPEPSQIRVNGTTIKTAKTGRYATVTNGSNGTGPAEAARWGVSTGPPLPVGAVGQAFTASVMCSNVSPVPSGAASTRSVSPGWTQPLSTSSASLFVSSRWTTRLSGRAPNTGS